MRPNPWIGLLIGGLCSASFAAPAPTTREQMTDAFVRQTRRDPEYNRFPRLREHVISIFRRRAPDERPLAIHASVAELIGGRGRPSVELTQDDLNGFFDACASDGATILRAIGFVGRAVHQTGVTVFMDGRLIRNALTRRNLALGLAMPVDDLAFFAYVPDAWVDPNYQCRFVAAYTRSYEHRFPKEVLDATLRIGTGKSATIANPWKRPPTTETVYLVEGAIVYGDAGVGLVNITGVGGKKHGILGAVQRILFFLPDAIDSMIIRNGDLYVKALVSQRVRDFERLPQYAVHRSGDVARPARAE
jgi:hypothetical protein